MSDESERMESSVRCSYCGKWVYEDLIRCPKCGDYTDGLGPLAKGDDPDVGRGGNERRFPRIFVVAGWLVIICMLLPLLIALYNWLQTR